MSSRAFAGIPRQFARAARVQGMHIPQMKRNIWKQTENSYNILKTIQRPLVPVTKSFKGMAVKLQTTEMRRLQIGALYMFSYITQDVLELLERYEEFLNDEESLEDEEQSTVTTTSLQGS